MDANTLLGLMTSMRGGKLRPAQLLQQMADESNDPAIARVVGTFLEEQSHEEEDAESDDSSKGERHRHATEVEHLSKLLRDAQEEISRLAAELSAATSHNDELAEALGACPECWGEERECGVCRGRGAPGSRRPPRDLFRRYVAPVLDAVRTSQRKDPTKLNGDTQ